tara:strand:+ start:85 stop:435 length:351 start_codon:yes stop_codon:yes gene_type:complete
MLNKEFIKNKKLVKISKLQGKLTALIHTEVYIKDQINNVYYELEKYGAELNPENFRDNFITNKIKTWLRGEISDVRKSHPTWDAEPDRHELGILDGRHECATNLLEQIEEWEKDDG